MKKISAEMMVGIVCSLLLLGVVLLPIACGAGYSNATAEQKAEVAFNNLELAFDTTEAVFVLLETDAIEHMPKARAAYAIVKTAIETYLENLAVLGIGVPDEATEGIEAMQKRAVELGVAQEE